jgi:hypothetical protein
MNKRRRRNLWIALALIVLMVVLSAIVMHRQSRVDRRDCRHNGGHYISQLNPMDGSCVDPEQLR